MSFAPKRILVPALIAFFLLSCSASRHAGVSNVKEPLRTENTKSAWVAFYADQFDALEGNVLRPDSRYPEAARQAYEEEKNEWSKRVKYAKGRTALACISVGIVFTSMTVYVLDGMLKHEEPISW